MAQTNPASRSRARKAALEKIKNQTADWQKIAAEIAVGFEAVAEEKSRIAQEIETSQVRQDELRLGIQNHVTQLIGQGLTAEGVANLAGVPVGDIQAVQKLKRPTAKSRTDDTATIGEVSAESSETNDSQIATAGDGSGPTDVIGGMS
jgi:hypothetical protein